MTDKLTPPPNTDEFCEVCKALKPIGKVCDLCVFEKLCDVDGNYNLQAVADYRERAYEFSMFANQNQIGAAS